MQEYLQANIKDIIQQFPEVGELLEGHKIACVSCGVGSCLLQDIMEIHNLSPDQERELMTQLARILYPDREIEIPRIERKRESTAGQYSPPVKKLVDEHSLIKRLLKCVPRLIDELTVHPQEAYPWVEGAVEFIRTFADRFHHAKEEDVLFKFFDENAAIFQVMHQDHEKARSHVRDLRRALQEKQDRTMGDHLTAYRDLLIEHIKKEDEVLYPWIDKNLNISQVGELFNKFAAIDKEFGDIPRSQEAFIQELEKVFSN